MTLYNPKTTKVLYNTRIGLDGKSICKKCKQIKEPSEMMVYPLKNGEFDLEIIWRCHDFDCEDNLQRIRYGLVSKEKLDKEKMKAVRQAKEIKKLKVEEKKEKVLENYSVQTSVEEVEESE